MDEDRTSGRVAGGQPFPAGGRGVARAVAPGSVHAPPRRGTRGPRPVRPGVAAATIRPAQPARPVCRAVPVRPGQRLLVRRPVPGPALARGGVPVSARVRQGLAGVVVALVTAAVVVGLGLLAGVVGGARLAEGAPTSAIDGPARDGSSIAVAGTGAVRVVTVGAAPAGGPQTVWEVAKAVAPDAEGPVLAAMVGRIVVANNLASAEVFPGQVLRVPLR